MARGTGTVKQVLPGACTVLLAAMGLAAAETSPASASGIGVGVSPLGVGVDASTGVVYVSNGRSNTVSVVDAATGAVTATIPVGATPVGVGVDPTRDTVSL